MSVSTGKIFKAIQELDVENNGVKFEQLVSHLGCKMAGQNQHHELVCCICKVLYNAVNNGSVENKGSRYKMGPLSRLSSSTASEPNENNVTEVDLISNGSSSSFDDKPGNSQCRSRFDQFYLGRDFNCPYHTGSVKTLPNHLMDCKETSGRKNRSIKPKSIRHHHSSSSSVTKRRAMSVESYKTGYKRRCCKRYKKCTKCGCTVEENQSQEELFYTQPKTSLNESNYSSERPKRRNNDVKGSKPKKRTVKNSLRKSSKNGKSKKRKTTYVKATKMKRMKKECHSDDEPSNKSRDPPPIFPIPDAEEVGTSGVERKVSNSSNPPIIDDDDDDENTNPRIIKDD